MCLGHVGEKYGLTVDEVKSRKVSIKRAVDKYREKEGDSPAAKDEDPAAKEEDPAAEDEDMKLDEVPGTRWHQLT